MFDVYLKDINIKVGEFCDLNKLSNDNLVFSSIKELEEFGYRGCYILKKDEEDYDKHVVDEFISDFDLDSIDYILYNNTFIEYKNYDSDQKNFMEFFLDYPLNRSLDKINKSIPHIGISQQACNGLFSCIEHAINIFGSNDKYKNVLCISEDILPKGCFYDRPSQRMLFSDTVSGAVLSKDKTVYKLIDIKNVHIPNDNYFLFVDSVIKLIKNICKINSLDLKDIKNYFVPNFWEDTWMTILEKIYDNNDIHYTNTIKIYAHGLSADFITNIKDHYAAGKFEKGGYYIGISYGYGGNISCLLFKYDN